MLNLAKNQLWSEGQPIISGCRLNRAFFAKPASSVPFTWTRGMREGGGHSTAQTLSPGYTGMCICVYFYINDRSRQDDVGTERTLRVKSLLSTVIGLSQRHGQRCQRVNLQETHFINTLFQRFSLTTFHNLNKTKT